MEDKICYIQIYTYTQDYQEFLQVNTFTPEKTLIMQTFLGGDSFLAGDSLPLLELEYPVQEDKYLSLKRSLDNNFPCLSEKVEGSEELQIKVGELTISKGPKKGTADPLFERLFEKFTRIVTYSSIPSG